MWTKKKPVMSGIPDKQSEEMFRWKHCNMDPMTEQTFLRE